MSNPCKPYFTNISVSLDIEAKKKKKNAEQKLHQLDRFHNRIASFNGVQPYCAI